MNDFQSEAFQKQMERMVELFQSPAWENVTRMLDKWQRESDTYQMQLSMSTHWRKKDREKWLNDQEN